MSPVRVVVVDVTIGVHIPRIVRVAPISRAQADVLRFSPHPCIINTISVVLRHSVHYRFHSSFVSFPGFLILYQPSI